MEKITQILENVVRCKYFEAGVHIKNPIEKSYQDSLGRTTQTSDHVVVHTLIWDKRKSQINEHSDPCHWTSVLQTRRQSVHHHPGFPLPSRNERATNPKLTPNPRHRTEWNGKWNALVGCYAAEAWRLGRPREGKGSGYFTSQGIIRWGGFLLFIYSGRGINTLGRHVGHGAPGH